jgi:hypothetical protein
LETCHAELDFYRLTPVEPLATGQEDHPVLSSAY